MKKRLCTAAGASLIAGLGLLLTGAPASAGGPQSGPQSAESSAEGDGVLSGNSVAVPIAVPVEIACNLNGIGGLGLGVGFSACDVDVAASGDSAGPVAGPQQATSSAEGDGVLSGNSVAAPISIPVEICGNGNGIGIAGVGIGGSMCDVAGGSGPWMPPEPPMCPAEPPVCPPEPPEPPMCPAEPPVCPPVELPCPPVEPPSCPPAEPPCLPEPPACPPALSMPWMW